MKKENYEEKKENFEKWFILFISKNGIVSPYIDDNRILELFDSKDEALTLASTFEYNDCAIYNITKSDIIAKTDN